MFLDCFCVLVSCLFLFLFLSFCFVEFLFCSVFFFVFCFLFFVFCFLFFVFCFLFFVFCFFFLFFVFCFLFCFVRLREDYLMRIHVGFLLRRALLLVSLSFSKWKPAKVLCNVLLSTSVCCCFDERLARRCACVCVRRNAVVALRCVPRSVRCRKCVADLARE